MNGKIKLNKKYKRFSFSNYINISDIILVIIFGVLLLWVNLSFDSENKNNLNLGVWFWTWLSVELPQYLWRIQEDGSVKLGVLGLGLINTLKISFFASFIAFFCGLFLALGRFSRFKFFALFIRSYVTLVRNLPPLVFLLILHFFFSLQILPALATFSFFAWANLDQSQNLNFISAVLALGLYEAAYVSEILRGSILAVPIEQWQAAASLGLKKNACLRKIIMPQALRYALPTLTGQLISLVKDSSILSIISIQELSFQATERMASNYKVYDVWFSVIILYLIINLSISLVSKYLERSFKWNV